MNKKRKWFLFSVGFLVVVLLAGRAVLRKGDEGTKVTADVVKRRTIIETVSASGKLYPETEIKVGSPVTGEVTILNVQEGDTVKKGQVLARVQGDRSGNSSPRVSIPNMPPGFESIVQGMQPPRTSAGPSSANIIAPISGTVTALNVKKGERTGAMQMPGSEMLRIADMNSIEVRVDVNENNIIRITAGDSADVEVEAYNKRKFKGVVTAIANGGTRREAGSFLSNDVTNYEVRIRLLPSSYADLFDSSKRRNMPFRPGMNARAEIKTRKRENILTVPVGAVVSKSKGDESKEAEEAETETKETTEAIDETTGDELEEVVYVLRPGGTVEKRVVTTGIQDINHFEISDGLKEGEQVITGPYNAVSKTLRTSSKVKVVTKEKLFQND